MQKLWLALFSALLGIAPAQAQNFTMPPPAGVTVGGFVVVASCAAQSLAATQGFGTMDTTGALCVNATVSASVTGFTPNGSFTNLTATGSSADAALPSGVTVQIQNTGTTAVSCGLSVGAGTAIASQLVIQSGSTKTVVVGSNTHASCIDQTGSASNVVVLAGGAGLGNDSGGGGGGSGGSVTQGTSPWVVGQATASSLNAQVVGPGATGAALVGNPVRVALSDGTNTQNWLTALILGDGVNGNNTGATASWLYNGTTWDRARGDATNGAFVNVKTSVLPTGAATAALQGTNTATTAHTCSVAGFSELGCLGQIDDDVKGPVAAGTARIGYTSDDVCTQKAKTNLPISQNGTSSVQLIALSGSTVISVCSLTLVAAGATTVAITTGTGTACITGNAAVIGSTTANIANSMSFAANGGLTLGNGSGTIAQGAASSELCMILGTNVFVSGNLTYVQQ